MSAQHTNPTTSLSSSSSAVDGKKPYQKPQVISSEMFERLALGCNGFSSGRNAGRAKPGNRACTIPGPS